MKSKKMIILLSLLLCIGLGAPAWAQSQGDQGDKGQMMGGGMHHQMMGKMQGQGKMGGGMGGCPMAMGSGGGCPMGMAADRGDCRGFGKCGCPGGGWMGSFHQWMKNFMIHADLFNLSDKQTQELESRFAEQYKQAVRTKADIKLMKIDLIETLRKEPIQVKQVREIMNRIAGKKIDMKINFLEFYTQTMQSLDQNQQQKVRDVLGNPFPMPWEQMMSMGDDGGGKKQGGRGGK